MTHPPRPRPRPLGPLALTLAAVALGLLVPTAHAQEGGLRAGAAAVNITPPAGAPMAGYYHERAADGVHDELFARAIVLESGGTKAALVSLDLITTTIDLVADARAAIETATGIPGGNVMISATHAHTGPVISSPSKRAAVFGGTSPLALQYRAELPGKIAEAVRKANAALVPARARTTRGREDTLGFNRRFHMTDGTVGWNPGKRNPKIVKPAGTTDPDVPIVAFETAEATPKAIATYVNYSVHLDNIGGARISADLPGVLAQALALFQAPDAVTLWTAGCCGDVNHIDVQSAAPQGGFENATRMGLVLAGAVLKAWPKLEPVAAPRLQVERRSVPLDLAPITPDDVTKAKATLDRFLDAAVKEKPSFLETVDAFKVMDVVDREGQPLQVEVQVITLGDQVAWVSLPGEIFVELGLAIKQDSPYPVTAVAELANGAIGYIPSQRAYAQGNYEVISARCAPGSGERLVAAALELLARCKASTPGAAVRAAGR